MIVIQIKMKIENVGQEETGNYLRRKPFTLGLPENPRLGFAPMPYK